MLKTCSKCRQAKPRSEFGKSKDRKDGLYPQCRACRAVRDAAYRAEHRDEILAKAAAYYAEHRDEALAKAAAYYDEHRDEILAKAAAYRDEHADELRAYNAAYSMTAAGMLAQVRYNAKRRGNRAT